MVKIIINQIKQFINKKLSLLVKMINNITTTIVRLTKIKEIGYKMNKKVMKSMDLKANKLKSLGNSSMTLEYLKTI